MNNINSAGAITSDGLQNAPSISFINDMTTGLYLNNAGSKSIAITKNAQSIAAFNASQIILSQPLKLNVGASDQSILATDPLGNSFWKVANANGVITWNWTGFFANIDYTQPAYTISTNVVFPSAFLNTPSVVLSKETTNTCNGVDAYVTNKTVSGFTINSNFPIYKKIAASTGILDYGGISLINGNIGMIYYDSGVSLMKYVYIVANSVVSLPVLIETTYALSSTCLSINMVGIYPAIVYQVLISAGNYAWRYAIANDVNGATWKTPITIASATSILASNNLISLLMYNSKPVIFITNSSYAIQLFVGNDTVGTSFGSAITISGLSNCRLLDVQLVNGIPAVLALSSTGNFALYYTTLISVDGTTWTTPTQIYKSLGVNLSQSVSGFYKKSACIYTIGGIPNIVIIEANAPVHNVNLITANNATGTSWGYCRAVIVNYGSADNPQLSVFQNNGILYALWSTAGSNSNIVSLISTGTGIGTPKTFINTISGTTTTNNIIVPDKNDNNNMIIMNNGTSLYLINYFDTNTNINWTAID